MILSILKVAACLIQGTFDLAVVFLIVARDRKAKKSKGNNGGDLSE